MRPAVLDEAAFQNEDLLVGLEMAVGRNAASAAVFAVNRRWWTTCGRRGVPPVVPARKDERTNPRFDQVIYRQPKLVERCVGWPKENRQLATRHAKLAVDYLATVELAMIRHWLGLPANPSDRT